MRLEDAPVIGEIEPMPDGLDLPYWDGLAAGELRIQRCRPCGRWIWGPQWMCPSCYSFELSWSAVALTGLVYSWIRTWHPFAPELAAHLPYTSVLVELPQAGGVRLLGLLVDGDGSEPAIGDPLEGRIQPASELTTGLAVLRWSPATSR
jgi:uncharacterized protein